jgi:hypothetical protein
MTLTASEPLPDTPFYRRMAAGHLARTGHKLAAVLAPAGDSTWKVQRSCCGSQPPAQAARQ